MRSNYDRKQGDKENSYASELRPREVPFKHNEAKQVIDHSLAEREDNCLQADAVHCKPNGSYTRENARRRCFDLKVSNIDSIHSKISGLLDMVKRDRQRDTLQTQAGREASKSPNYTRPDKNKPAATSSRVDKFISRDQRAVSAFGEEQKEKPTILDSEEVQPAKMRKIRTKYHEDESAKEESTFFERIEMEEIESRCNQRGRYNKGKNEDRLDAKNPNRTRDEPSIMNHLQEQKASFDRMLEDRKRQRQLNRQSQGQMPSEPGVYQHKSAIKPRRGYREDEVPLCLKTGSPISRVKQSCFESKEDSSFARMKTPSPRRPSVPKREGRKFAEVSYLEQNGQHQRQIDSTARLIDQQLVKIKDKITESGVSQNRIESFKPKNTNFKQKPKESAAKYQVKEHTIRIAEQLSSQVQLDNLLKPARESFESLRDEDKWTQLQRMLLAKGMRIDSKVLRELVQIGPDEHNPFGGEKRPTSKEGLAELLAAAEANWESSVLKCASMASLESESFQVRDLDLSQKGWLGPEDLVCFVNLYGNTFYRNRDLSLVMRRLKLMEGGSPRGGVDFLTFFEAFAG